MAGVSHCRRAEYPSQLRFFSVHCRQEGLPSSHLILRARQVQHPVNVFVRFRGGVDIDIGLIRGLGATARVQTLIDSRREQLVPQVARFE